MIFLRPSALLRPSGSRFAPSAAHIHFRYVLMSHLRRNNIPALTFPYLIIRDDRSDPHEDMSQNPIIKVDDDRKASFLPVMPSPPLRLDSLTAQEWSSCYHYCAIRIYFAVSAWNKYVRGIYDCSQKVRPAVYAQFSEAVLKEVV